MIYLASVLGEVFLYSVDSSYIRNGSYSYSRSAHSSGANTAKALHFIDTVQQSLHLQK